MALSRIRRTALVAALSFSVGIVSAKAEAANDVDAAPRPTTFSGSYLAGRNADAANDLNAALTYLNHALEFDRGFPALSNRVLMLRLAAGEIDSALELAEKLVVTDVGNPAARLALAAAAIKDGLYDLAKSELQESFDSPLDSLIAGLLGAWADQGQGKTDEALAAIDELTGPAWYPLFKDFHRALIADADGRKAEADAAITKVYKLDGATTRIVETYARIKARNGDSKEAMRALTEYAGNEDGSRVINDLLAQLKAGAAIPPIAANPQTGGAELFFGLGAILGSEDGARLAAIYLQLAHFLDPDFAAVSMALGDIFNRANQCGMAIDAYAKVPESSPLHRNATIRTGLCLNILERADEGAEQIKRVIAADPGDIAAAMALGNLYRSHDRFAEAGEAYTVGIDTMTDEAEADWRLFYFRGISYEQTERWPEAEADFKRALELNPDQPLVLNYLGYSWVDKGLNLDEALDMIRTAVELRPTDGYIVDSLGWAYYRLERYQEAVEQLERAVERRSEDPIINDHLGDAYWHVGRKREALFQWTHARDLGPTETELPKILAKIENGFSAAPPAVAADSEAPAAASDSNEATLAAVDPADGAKPSSITVEVGDSLSTIAERIYGNSDLFFRIYDANKDKIDDPDIIYPGMTLTIPSEITN